MGLRNNSLFVVTVEWDQTVGHWESTDMEFKATGEHRCTDTWNVLCEYEDQAVTETNRRYKDRRPIIKGVQCFPVNEFLLSGLY